MQSRPISAVTVENNAARMLQQGATHDRLQLLLKLEEQLKQMPINLSELPVLQIFGA